MKRIVLSAVFAAATTVSAYGQSSTAVGVGVSRSDATATSQSTAIGGGNATARGGNAVATGGAGGRGGTGVGVGTGGNPIAAVTIQGTQVPTSTTQNLVTSGTSTVKNVPSVFAPGLAAAGLETCLGSVSGGGSFVGTGFSFGSTIPDPGCGARLDARTLWSMGLKKAAIARLCLNPDINRSMPEICGTYLPQPVGYGAAIAVAPAESDYYYASPSDYRGGPIMLVDGKSGQDRLCSDWNASNKKCKHWADAPEVKHTRVAAAKTSVRTPAPTPKPIMVDPPPPNAAPHAEAGNK